MPLTFRSGESLGAAKARQSGGNTFASIRQAMTSNAAYSAPKPDPKPKKRAKPKTSTPMAQQKQTTKANTGASAVRVATKNYADPKPAAKPAAKPSAPIVDKGMDAREAAYIKPAAPTKAPTPKTEPAKKNLGTQISEAVEKIASGGIIGAIGKMITEDKYRHGDTPAYNQAYWAKRREEVGAAQAAKEVQALGHKKAYSGDVVVTKEDQLAAQYKMKGIGEEAYKRGIKPTVTTEQKGLLGETTVTKSVYDFGEGGGKYDVTQEVTSPVLGGIRFGKDVTKTYVDGVAVATKTGDEPAALPERGHIADRATIEPESLTTVEQVQAAIDQTTDKAELAALHKRLRSLMRAQRTRTQFAGLQIGEAEVEATRLGGLRI